jgi:hypothetical protein
MLSDEERMELDLGRVQGFRRGGGSENSNDEARILESNPKLEARNKCADAQDLLVGYLVLWFNI